MRLARAASVGVMTFDGSPEHTRHGVGGFPKVTEQPSRAGAVTGRGLFILALSAAIVFAVVVVVVLINL